MEYIVSLDRIGRKLANSVRFLSEKFADIGCFLIFFIAISTTIDVCMRFFFNKPTVWVVEVSEYALGALIVLGVSYTHKLRGHVMVDILIAHLPLRIWQCMLVIISILSLGASIVVSVLVFNLWYEATVIGQSTWSSLEVPLWFLYGYYLIGMIALSLQCIVNLSEDIANVINAFKKQTADNGVMKS